MRLGLTTLTGIALSACAPEVKVIDYGTIPILQQFDACPPGTEGYQRLGMSCFSGVQLYGSAGYHGDFSAASPTITSQTDAGYEASINGEVFGAIFDGSADGMIRGDFMMWGCDEPASMRVSTSSPGISVRFPYGPSVVGVLDGPAPSFVSGTVNIEGISTSEPPSDVSLSFDGSPSGCSASLTIPHSHIAALRKWAAESNVDEMTRRQELAQ